MPKQWEELTVDEKLDWLHAAIVRFADTGNTNSDSLNIRDETITSRLAEAEAAIRSVKEEIRELGLKHRS